MQATPSPFKVITNNHEKKTKKKSRLARRLLKSLKKKKKKNVKPPPPESTPPSEPKRENGKRLQLLRSRLVSNQKQALLRSLYKWRVFLMVSKHREESRSRATRFQSHLISIRDDIETKLKESEKKEQELLSEISRLEKLITDQKEKAGQVTSNLTDQLLKSRESSSRVLILERLLNEKNERQTKLLEELETLRTNQRIEMNSRMDTTQITKTLRKELESQRQENSKLSELVRVKSLSVGEQEKKVASLENELHVISSHLEEKRISELKLSEKCSRLEAETERLSEMLKMSRDRESELEIKTRDDEEVESALRRDLEVAKAASGATVAEVLALREAIEERDLVIEQMSTRVSEAERKLNESESGWNSRIEEKEREIEKERMERTNVSNKASETEHELRDVEKKLRDKIRDMEVTQNDLIQKLSEVEEQRSRDVAKFQSRARSVEAHEVAERELAQSKSKLKEELEIERNTIAKLRSEAQRERRETAILRARLESVEQEETKLVKELQHKEEEVTKLRNSIKRKAEETARVKQKGAEDETAVLDAQNTLLRLEEKLARSEEKRVALGAALSAAERKIAEQVKVWAATSSSGDGSCVGSGDGDEMLRQKLAKSEQERMKLAGVLLKLMKKQEALKRESSKKRVVVLNTGHNNNSHRSGGGDLGMSMGRFSRSSSIGGGIGIPPTKMKIVRGGAVDGEEMVDSPSKVAAVTLKRLEHVLEMGGK